MEIDKLKEELVARARFIHQELCLSEWRIGIRFVQPSELDDPTHAAETHVSAEYLKGDILVNEFALSRYTLEEWRETLWHEYIHVLQSPIEELLDKWARGPHISAAQYQERQDELRHAVEPVVERLGRFLAARLRVVEKPQGGLLAGFMHKKELNKNE